MEVVPVNGVERTFTVITSFFGMVAFSSFVSLLTASMNRLNSLRNDESRQFWLLRRYLRDWGVSYKVGSRVQRYLEFAYQKQRARVQESEVSLFALLSDPLRDEIKHEIFAVHISAHPLLSHCPERTFRKALFSSSLARGDILFACGEEATSMLFATNGTFMYVLGQVLDDAHLHSLATSSRTSSADSEYYEDDAEAEYISAEGSRMFNPSMRVFN
jgi:hypothetical protein